VNPVEVSDRHRAATREPHAVEQGFDAKLQTSARYFFGVGVGDGEGATTAS
jgi:hypothetical protein